MRRPTQKAPLFSLDRPLTASDLETYERELDLLQGNILKSHGRAATVNVFLTFNAGKVVEASKFIRDFAKRVTSAAEQRAQSERLKARRAPAAGAGAIVGGGELFVGFYLTAKGCEFLGLRTDGFCEPFREGLRQAQVRLDDPPVASWDVKFQQDIHAMVLFAHDVVSELVTELGSLRNDVGSFATVSSEFGIAMKNAAGKAIEHFGYVDGVSQPLFFEADLPSEVNFQSAAGPDLVLFKDPNGESDAECGTYVVFRKLEQNVRGFKQRERVLSRRLRCPVELAGAFIVGRFPDGTPVALAAGQNGQRENDFVYASADKAGNKCPFFAHIRKANRRKGNERYHRIARRGITYGDPTPPGADEATWPAEGVGLLFQCCQADLQNQFEVIHKVWANNPNFPHPESAQDPVIGRPRKKEAPLRVPNRWGYGDRTTFTFGEFVRMRGGEYFFTPSIAVLRRIGGRNRALTRTRGNALLGSPYSSGRIGVKNRAVNVLLGTAALRRIGVKNRAVSALLGTAALRRIGVKNRALTRNNSQGLLGSPYSSGSP